MLIAIVSPAWLSVFLDYIQSLENVCMPTSTLPCTLFPSISPLCGIPFSSSLVKAPPTSWGLLRVSSDRGVYTRLPLLLPACSRGICCLPLLIVQSDFWCLRIWIGPSWFIDWLIQRGRCTLQIPVFWHEKVCNSNTTKKEVTLKLKKLLP